MITIINPDVKVHFPGGKFEFSSNFFEEKLKKFGENERASIDILTLLLLRTCVCVRPAIDCEKTPEL